MPDKQKVVLFTDRKNTAPLFKSLSKTYKDKLVFGEIKKDKDLLEKFKITSVPKLLVLTDPHDYSGEFYDMTDIKID